MIAVLCTDGSDLAHHALAEGLRVLARPDRIVIATVIDAVDPSLVVGTGFAGGVMSPEEVDDDQRGRREHAAALLEAARAGLGIEAELLVLEGRPGEALCDLAAQLPASVAVLGTRGHSGIRRAVLGSVSDHVVRHAPCPVLVIAPPAVELSR
jgi:nucleotide-binding universal stress UspA family protein